MARIQQPECRLASADIRRGRRDLTARRADGLTEFSSEQLSIFCFKRVQYLGIL